jgi:hypothetical protein
MNLTTNTSSSTTNALGKTHICKEKIIIMQNENLGQAQCAF